MLTADDIRGENGLGDYSQEEPVLCPVGATVRMVGAPVALVVAETPAALKAGLAAIEVGYEILPHVFETDEALAPGATHIAGRGDNVLTSFAVQHGDLDAAFADSAAIVEAEYRTAFLEHSALERETLLGYYDEEGRLTVTGGNHEPFYQQKYIANALALPLDQVRVIMPPTGGSFGGKQDPWPFIATALMTQAVRRPVRLVYSRTESFDATPKRHPYVVRSKIGATADGRLTGIRVRIDANTGGYDAGGQYIPNYAVTASGGPYHWQAVDAYAQTVYTNGPKAGQYRGFGTAQSAFAAECALDELAEKLGIDPLEFRLKNTLRTGETSFLGYPVAETIGFTQVLEALRPHYEAYLADADAFNRSHLSPVSLSTRLPTFQRSNAVRGVGLAGMWYRFGKSGTLRIEAHAELAQDGHFIVYCTAADYGQGMNTVVSQMAAEALGVSRARIEIVNGDTARVPDSAIQGASRATYFVGGAVTAAARALKDEILGIAAELLDRDPLSLRMQEDRLTAPSGANVSLTEIAAEFDRIGKSRRLRGFFDLTDQFPIDDHTRIRAALRHRRARGRGGGGSADGRDARPADGRGARCRPRGQPAGRRGTDRRRHDHGHRRGADGRGDPRPHPWVHRLLPAHRQIHAADRRDPGRSARLARSARRQRPGRGGHAPGHAGDHQRDVPCHRRAAARDPGHAGAGVAGDDEGRKTKDE